jgi:hypothetical protein
MKSNQAIQKESKFSIGMDTVAKGDSVHGNQPCVYHKKNGSTVNR